MSLDVTPRDSALCTADSAPGPAERETADPGAETLHSAMTEGDRRSFDTAAWRAKFGAYCTPPVLLTERRPAVDTMRRYAERGRYTAHLNGTVRTLGVVWFRAVAVPGLVAARVWEWLTERPARFLVVAGTVKLLTFLPPVAWLVDHVITPGAGLALRIFL